MAFAPTPEIAKEKSTVEPAFLGLRMKEKSADLDSC